MRYDYYNKDPHSYVDFGHKQLAMTFKPGQIIPGKGDTEPDEAARRSRGKYANAADILASDKAVRAFIHRALTYIYGPKWHERTDVYFVVEAMPETKSKDGTDTANLHYHITFGYLHSDHKRVKMMKNAFLKAANEIEQRLFGRQTLFYVDEVRNLQNYRKYVLKHQDISRDGFDGILITSTAKRHSLMNSSRSGTVETRNWSGAQRLLDTGSRAEVATTRYPQAPHQEKLVPLEVRGASSEAVSGNPLAMSLGSQKQSEKPATERDITERLIHNNDNDNDNDNDGYGYYSEEDDAIDYYGGDDYTERDVTDKIVQNNNGGYGHYSEDDEPLYGRIFSEPAPLKTHNLEPLRASKSIECYVAKVKRSKTPENRNRDPEMVYLDAATLRPVSKFRPNKIGNVTLYMACMYAGIFWERTEGLLKLKPRYEADAIRKSQLREDLDGLLQPYLSENYPDYFENDEASWKETIEIAIAFTSNDRNIFWAKRKTKAVNFPASDSPFS